jgi:hypothetical protein
VVVSVTFTKLMCYDLFGTLQPVHVIIRRTSVNSFNCLKVSHVNYFTLKCVG